MKKLSLLASALLAPGLLAQTPIDLNSQFDRDVFLETGGTGLGDPLDAEGRRIDAGTLPEGFTDGSLVTTQDGRTVFRFGSLTSESLDAVAMNGQTIEVTDGQYGSIDLALLSAPGAFPNPFSNLEFLYTDGSSSTGRLGPVAGWFSTPTAYDNALFRYSDQSGVEEIVDFQTDGIAEYEVPYLIEERGVGTTGDPANPDRFVDGTGFALFKIADLAGIEEAKLGITVGNNFVVSLATEYHDPFISTTDGYTVVANSMDIYGVEHRANGNLKEYEFDVSEQLAAGTGELYILFTDATTGDGWGPYIQQIRLYTGEALTFEERLQPVVDTSDATVHANFQIASDEETPFLYDNSGAGPSARGHRFADAGGSLTYRFDLPDDTSTASLTVDMENNFVVSLAGATAGTVFAKVEPGTPEESTYLIDAGGSVLQGNARFADAASYMIYQFDLPDDTTTAFARIHIGNQYVISVASGTDGEFQVEQDYVAETGNAVTDNSNLGVQSIDISSYLQDNPTKTVRIQLTDGIPTDGWGPFLRGIEIAPTEASYVEVLNSQEQFGEDIHNGWNRGYYPIDLTPILTDNNPTREVYVKFTDASTSDGWGPSLYWMAVYTGEIDILGDELVFSDLKSTFGDPAPIGINLLHRRYELDASKTLTSIKLPEQSAGESSQVYLLAATLNEGSAPTGVELQVTQQSEDTLRISWPTTEGVTLQSAPSLADPVQWTDSSATPQVNGGVSSVDVQTTGDQQFFRLVR